MAGEKGPWGTRNEDIDALRTNAESADRGDAPLVDVMLQEIRKDLIPIAKQKGITFKSEFKSGNPSFVSLLEGDGDISELLEDARRQTAKVNAMEFSHQQKLEFLVEYSKGKTGERSTLVISGWKKASA